jgi:hypothetical protein
MTAKTLPTATHPVFAQALRAAEASAPTGKQKLLPRLTHLRGGNYAPQMEDICKSNSPDGYC